MEAGTVDTDGVRHSAKVAWRALANLEKELERAEEASASVVDPADFSRFTHDIGMLATPRQFD